MAREERRRALERQAREPKAKVQRRGLAAQLDISESEEEVGRGGAVGGCFGVGGGGGAGGCRLGGVGAGWCGWVGWKGCGWRPDIAFQLFGWTFQIYQPPGARSFPMGSPRASHG